MTAPSTIDLNPYGVGAFGDGVYTQDTPGGGKCKYCDQPVTHRVVWADHRAVVKVDRRHIAKAEQDIRAQGAEPERVDEWTGSSWKRVTEPVSGEHSRCADEAAAYGSTYCLATRKPGPCLGQHRPGTVIPPPRLVPVPGGPSQADQAKLAAQRMQDPAYRRAYLQAEQVAQSAGLQRGGHAGIAGPMHDYATALRQHHQAETAAQSALVNAQKAHDSAVARNQAQQANYQARVALAAAKAQAVTQRAALHHAARQAAGLTPFPMGGVSMMAGDTAAYALADHDGGAYALAGEMHMSCLVGEFCRNPLHPGPCKGWKHMLHSVAPGAYHAYERQRVDQLNQKRLAKIEALKKLGHPVPAYLLKPHTYPQVPKAPVGMPFGAPTPKEAEAKLPATAKEIGTKIGMKYAALAQAKAVHVGKADEILDLYQKTDWSEWHPSARANSYKKLGEIIDNPHTTSGQKLQAKAIQQKIQDSENTAHLIALLGDQTASNHAKLVAIGALSKDDFDKLGSAHRQVVAGELGRILAEVPQQSKPVVEELAHKLGVAGPVAQHAKAAVASPVAAHYSVAQKNAVEVVLDHGAGKVTKHQVMAALDHLTYNDVQGLSEDHKASLRTSLQKIADEGGLLSGAAKATLSGWSKALGGHTQAVDVIGKLKDEPYNSGKLGVLGDLTKAQFDALPQHDQNLVMHLLDGMHGHPGPGPATKAKAAELIQKFKPGLVYPGAGPTSAAPLPSGIAAHVLHAKTLASGAKSGTASQKHAAYEKLTPAEYHSLPLPVQESIHTDLQAAHAKFLAPHKKAAVQATLDKFGMPSEFPGGAGAPHGGSAVPHSSKHLAGHLAALKATGAWSSPGEEKAIKEDYAAGENQAPHAIAEILAEQWASKYVPGVLASDERATLQHHAQTEIQHMIENGQTEPDKDGVLSLAQTLGETGSAVDWKYAASKLAGGQAPGAGTSIASSSLLGKGTTITKLTQSSKEQLLGSFKMQPLGSQLKDPPEHAYDALLAIAHAYNGKPGFGKLSMAQVIKAIDETHAKNLGVSNAGLLEQKIHNWLATSEGKAYALTAQPKPAILEPLAAALAAAKATKGGKKVPELGGPGGFNKAQAHFPVVQGDNFRAMQDKYMTQTGQSWTPEQEAALVSYTSASGSMNNWLRGSSDADPLTKQSVINAQNGMRPIQADVLLHRGTGWEAVPSEYRDPESVKKLIGKTISDPAFLSTSTGGSAAFGSRSVIFEIEAPKGTMGAYVDHISDFPGEREVLLAAGTKLKLLAVTKSGLQTVIRVRVVSGKIGGVIKT